MVTIKVKCKNAAEMLKTRREIHNALIGCVAYITDDIIVSDAPGESNCFYIGFGGDNGVVIHYECALEKEKSDD